MKDGKMIAILAIAALALWLWSKSKTQAAALPGAAVVGPAQVAQAVKTTQAAGAITIPPPQLAASTTAQAVQVQAATLPPLLSGQTRTGTELSIGSIQYYDPIVELMTVGVPLDPAKTYGGSQAVGIGGSALLTPSSPYWDYTSPITGEHVVGGVIVN